MQLLTMGSAVEKIAKSDRAGRGYLSSIMYLAPHRLSGWNVCSHASEGCIAGCLFTSGYGRYSHIQQARIRRTRLFFEDRDAFKAKLWSELAAFVRKADRKGLKPAFRPNGTSDLPWEQLLPELFTDFPMVQFYDYTKITRRAVAFAKGDLPSNYHLTFSRSEKNESKCLRVLRERGNVAVVFDTKDLPDTWYGYDVHNADENDLRFLDPVGVQGLYPKGRARHDKSGFVVRTTVKNGRRLVLRQGYTQWELPTVVEILSA